MAKGSEQKAKVSNVSTFRNIPLDLIDQGEQLIRETPDDDDIAELAADIAAHGLMQPIGVRSLPDGRYQLLWGDRRRRAHLRLHRVEILAHVDPTGSDSVVGTAARENLLRRALSLEEECDAVSRLHHTDGKSPAEISSLTGKSRSWVLRRLAVPQLPDDLRGPLLDGTLSLDAAETLSQLDDIAARAYAINQVRIGRLTSSQTRELVKAMVASPSMEQAVMAGVETAASQRQPEEILIRCAHCRTPRPPHELQIVRLCAPHLPCNAEEEHADGNATDPTSAH